MLKFSDLPTHSTLWEPERPCLWDTLSYKAQLFVLRLYMDYVIEWKWARLNQSGFRYSTRYISMSVIFTENDEPMSFVEFSGWVEINLRMKIN
jgi:hypothetical protein